MLTAGAVMTKKVASARPDDTVAEVARLLTAHDISAVPVCDASGALLGMLSEGDLMRPFGEAFAMKRAWWLNILAEGTDIAPAFVDYLRMDHRKASDLMSRPVITATESMTLPEIADLLAEHHIKRVPIVRDGKIVGIVSRADIVRALATKPGEVVEPA